MTYKDKENERVASKERMRRMRQGVTKGVTKTEGVTALGAKGVTYPDILNKLTDKTWRKKLSMLNDAFKTSHNPNYAKDTFLGVIFPDRYSLDVVFDLMECTR